MKLTIDTTNKTINVKEDVNLHTLMKAVRKMLPDGEWKEYQIINTDERAIIEYTISREETESFTNITNEPIQGGAAVYSTECHLCEHEFIIPTGSGAIKCPNCNNLTKYE